MTEIKFNKDAHSYMLNGKRMTGCTTILSIISKPALISWSANQACDYIQEESEWKKTEKSERLYEVTQETILEARKAWTKKRDEAGTAGTDVHELIEEWIKKSMQELMTVPSNNEQVKHFIDWATKNKVKFLASEKVVYSKDLFVAGTLDFLCEINGKRYIGDIKTSKAIWKEAFYQMAGYRIMLDAMGENDLDGSVVVRLGKDGKFDEKKDVQFRTDYETDKKAFMGALAIYRANATHKKTY